MTPDERREQYRLQRARYERLASRVAETVTEALRKESIQHFVSYRSKHPDDVAEKIARKLADGKTRYRDAIDLNEIMTDLAGVRIVVYDPDQEKRAAQVVRSTFKIRPSTSDEFDFEKPRTDDRNSSTAYCATHITVQAATGDPLTEGACCEVQVCNIVAHVFNEFEHDIQYKHKHAAPRVKTLDALERVRAKTRELENAVHELLGHHKRDAQEQHLNANDADDLKRGLESFFGKPLSGNFELFFAFAQSIFNPVSVHALRPASLEDRAASVLGRIKTLVATEDATRFLLACIDGREEEARDLLDGWLKEYPGDSGEMIDAIKAMAAESAA